MARKISHSLINGRAGAGTGGQGLKVEWDSTNDGELHWKDVDESSLEVVSGGTGSVGLFTSGGHVISNVTNQINISSTGNATSVSTMPTSSYTHGACSNQTRGVAGGGRNGSTSYNRMEYMTFASIATGIDFGDLTVSRGYCFGTSNGTSDRGVFVGGGTWSGNTIDYITIATTGNATDFGDISINAGTPGTTSNGTSDRMVVAVAGEGSTTNVIEYATISSASNTTDFGDLSTSRKCTGATSNDVGDRAIFTSHSSDDTIDYVTISSAGNATDFGDLTVYHHAGGYVSNGTDGRGVICGGEGSGGYTNVIEYITFASPGNGTDFGDLTASFKGWAGMSGA